FPGGRHELPTACGATCLFYCDYCDPFLTHDSASVRKTHCSGRKHEENVKDYYQKCIEGQAQGLADKTTAISTRKDTFYSILCSSSCRGNDPTSPQSPRTSCPGMKLAPHMGGPPMMPMMSPSPPGIMPVGPAPRMRLPMGSHIPMMPGPPVMRPSACLMMVPTWRGKT
uniref:Matrin-type domain-containing protein n=1 Tax=Bos mutus grunniens TaxID=30521 RepID=A0A8B9W410_BOSMU